MIAGYNYHPPTQGVDYWRIWDFDEIKKDIGIMASEGFNVIRFFIFWRDFEPCEGHYDEEMFSRLRCFVRTVEEHGMKCIPSIMTIWMNGHLFDLHWRSGRSLWKDPVLMGIQKRFVEKVSSELSVYSNIMAYDLGDEMLYADWPAALKVQPEDAEKWLSEMVSALRAGDPSAKIIMAHDYTSAFGSHSFQLELLSRHLDFIAIHGFPLWSPLSIESNDSYKASLFVPFLVKYASAFGSPLLDEFGLYAASEHLRKNYVITSGTSSLLHGAKGVIGWCWRDLTSTTKPYSEHLYEKSVGYYDSEGNAKPSAEALKRCIEEVSLLLDGTPEKAEVAIYISEINRTISRPGAVDFRRNALYYSSLLLMRLHVPFELITEGLGQYKVVIVPGNDCLNKNENDLLTSFVQNGGVVLYSPGSCLRGFGGEELFGNALVDFSLYGKESWKFTFGSRRYEVNWESSRFEQVPVIESVDSEVLARYEGNLVPALTVKTIGNGKAYYLNAPIELYLDEPYLLEKEHFRWLYQYVLLEAIIEPYATCSCVEIEVHTRHYEHCDRCILINHSPQDRKGVLTLRSGIKLDIHLEKKTVAVINVNGAKVVMERLF